MRDETPFHQRNLPDWFFWMLPNHRNGLSWSNIEARIPIVIPRRSVDTSAPLSKAVNRISLSLIFPPTAAATRIPNAVFQSNGRPCRDARSRRQGRELRRRCSHKRALWTLALGSEESSSRLRYPRMVSMDHHRLERRLRPRSPSASFVTATP
jgi:hypothetical protein